MQDDNVLSGKKQNEFFQTLQERFQKNIGRHTGLEWGDVRRRLEDRASTLRSLYEMELSGGEPDVVEYDVTSKEYVFYDCSPESPAGRRNLCYDREALDARKNNKPEDSATDVAAAMGIEILTEEQYRKLQNIGEFDTKTSSWIATPSEIRELGGALFCDRRYNHVFVYHNGAESYYSSRGFRGLLRV